VPDRLDDELDIDVGPEEPQRSAFPVAISLLFGIAGAIGVVWAYVARASNVWIGGCLALAFAGLGFALAYWGAYLVGDRQAAGRYPIRGGHEDEEGQAALGDELLADLHVITRRRFLAVLLGGALGIFALSQLVFLGSLGSLPRRKLFHTQWRAGSRLVTADGAPVTSTALQPGGYLVVFPEGHVGAADSQVALLRLQAGALTPLKGRENWSPDGYVAYSRLCTHAGCPVAQFEHLNNVLSCPCHQSTFDVLRGARPVSGPAGRALPQLPLAIDANGFLIAQSDFTQPVGPGFWDIV
jgi:ubiquinol-cytochrome c reductase iron-sulfur subunit